jgi:hypothetical protein
MYRIKFVLLFILILILPAAGVIFPEGFFSIQEKPFAHGWKRPQITVILDLTPRQVTVAEPFPANTPIEIIYSSDIEIGKSTWIYLKYNGDEYITKRVYLPGDGKPATFWFYPMIGEWEAGIYLGYIDKSSSIFFRIEGE